MLHLKNKDDITIYTSLKDYSKVLPPNFLRCHKSYMVNMNHITGYEPHKFIINTGEFIPIPPKKYNATVKTYKSYLENM
jgi:DNA-binding LytR/AlgR family response regulator